MDSFYPRSSVELRNLRPRQATMTSKVMAGGMFKKWLQDRNNQAGMAAAGQTILDGATTDPWGAIVRGIGTFFGERGRAQRQSEEDAKRDEALDYERQRQERLDARGDEEFGLRKRAAEAELAAMAEKRALAEQQREALKGMWGSLPPEDQKILGPLVSDPDKWYQVYSQREDDRRQQAQFDASMAETKRRNTVDERNDSARIGLERERNQITREGQQAKAARNMVKVERGYVNVINPITGEVLSSTELPKDRESAMREVSKIMIGTGRSAEEAFAEVQKIGDLVGRQPAVSNGDPAAREIESLIAEGLTDEDILAMTPPEHADRVKRILASRRAMPSLRAMPSH